MRNVLHLTIAFACLGLLHAEPPAGGSSKLSKETTRSLLENLSGLPPPIGGPIPEPEYQALREPMTLVLSGGREFQGTLSDVQQEQIDFRMVHEGGEVILSFPFDEIQEIFFPGKDIVEQTVEQIRSGDLTGALPYLESIIGARYALFPLIPPEDLSVFRALPLAALAVDNPAQAIAYAKAIKPYLTLPDDQKELRDVELLGYYRLQLQEEAEQLALAWIGEEDRFGDSALGYFILAALQFEAADYETALYTALEPIVFSGVLPKSYLAPCYSIAIASAHMVGDSAESEKLFREMKDRGIPWEPLLVFRSARNGLSDLRLFSEDGQPLTIIVGDEHRENLIHPRTEGNAPNPSLDPSNMVPL
jgi:hypothetical protein